MYLTALGIILPSLKSIEQFQYALINGRSYPLWTDCTLQLDVGNLNWF